MKFFNQITDFFLCLIRENCIYSIKKVLCFIFTALAIYMIIAGKTTMFIETLGFIAILLGIRSYERLKVFDNEGKNNVNSNIG